MKQLTWNSSNLDAIAKHLNNGGVAVIPTDTIYGLVAKADHEESVKKVYEYKDRNPEKKCIVLIGDIKDLDIFDVHLSEFKINELHKFWPGKFSVELPCTADKMSYLRRGTDSLSFRLPDDELLRNLLRLTGPLIAPSANPEGMEPARNIEMAIKYFGGKDILFLDGGEKVSEPSTIISLLGDRLEVIRGKL